MMYSHVRLDSPPSSGGIEPERPLESRYRPLQVGEVAEFGRNRAREIVRGEGQRPQVDKAAEFGWNRTCEAVAREEQIRQRGEVAEFGWNRAREIVCR